MHVVDKTIGRGLSTRVHFFSELALHCVPCAGTAPKVRGFRLGKTGHSRPGEEAPHPCCSPMPFMFKAKLGNVIAMLLLWLATSVFKCMVRNLRPTTTSAWYDTTGGTAISSAWRRRRCQAIQKIQQGSRVVLSRYYYEDSTHIGQNS